ncbi:Undecaprenyl phosphate-alpha-4-amino-4-deoxy-L-arabinose arabinosyl transferase [Andreprevotia sp. IGB-42]|uniref:phospholipid carrier-dependent glycosyltransferase n=1 Tax=Andreprevotia sp. IGB-42 TaxID=2497473 RepID=UPI00135C66BD|nr:phospholipid carrier-dependent glycosyltransferase [Andreprevotia sp. IGB-42]KAF0815467.1 Undecaprenyl phosphate-alpha-4-amino-4-deoxy-L-arabinose arabinosyl transferase [Andreprevotia sp. IGB-42]
MQSIASSRWAKWLALLLFATLWFGTLGYRKLISPDEGRYAEIGREMAVSGDWVTPRLNGIKYFEKPALQYWMTASSYKVFGESEFAARLWPALTGFAAVLVVFATLRRLYRREPDGEAIAWSGAALLGSSAWWIGNGHFLSLDMGVSAFLTMVLCGFLWAQHDDASKEAQRNGMLAAWAAMALATLSKGLIGIVIPGAALVCYTLWTQDWKVWARMHFGKGLALFLLLAAPWFLLVSHRNPEFAHFFFIHEHFQRYATEEARRVEPWHFFIPILLAGLLPWTALLPAIAQSGWRKQGGQRFQPQRFLLAWAAFVLLFFSASGSKLPSYILPMFPPLAMLAAPSLPRLGRKNAWALVITLLLAGIALLIVAPILAARAAQAAVATGDAGYANWLYATGGAMLLFAAIAAVMQWKKSTAGLVATLAVAGLVAGQIPMIGHNEYAMRKSSYALAEAVRPQLAANSTLYSVRSYDQTLPFYLKRTLQFVEYVDEFRLGQGIEPDKLIDMETFIQRWREDAAPVAVVEQDSYDKLKAQGLIMHILYSDTKRLVVAKP